jgi:hypothetical protein
MSCNSRPTCMPFFNALYAALAVAMIVIGSKASLPDLGNQLLDVIAYLSQHLVGVLTRLPGQFHVLFALVPQPLDLFAVLNAARFQPDQPDKKRHEGKADRPERADEFHVINPARLQPKKPSP